MPLNVKIVDIDTLKSGNREDAYNSLNQVAPYLDLRVTGTLAGVTIAVFNPFVNPPTGTTLTLVEGADFADDASTLVTLKNLIEALFADADNPLKIAVSDGIRHHAVIDDPDNPGEAIARLSSYALTSEAKKITFTATGAGNEANIEANGAASPAAEPATNLSLPNAEVQLAAILNSLSPMPAVLADVRVEPLGIEGTRLLIYWPSA